MAIDIRGLAPLLQVFDMPASLQFYCDVLGFEVALTDGKPGPHYDWVLLKLHGTELMLNTAYEAPERPPRPDQARIAAHDDTGLFFACPDLDAAYHHLREKGVHTKESKVAPYGMKQLWFSDPDGYCLCFQSKA